GICVVAILTNGKLTQAKIKICLNIISLPKKIATSPPRLVAIFV
ncbi:hypothetical protein AAUPMB_13970, partial [Pasteurella multocida subsp. multocida str. Anand1_buffalo]